MALLLSSWNVFSAELWISLKGNQDILFLISNERSPRVQGWCLYTQNMQLVQENLQSIIAYPLDMSVYIQFGDGEVQTYTLTSYPQNFDITPHGNEESIFHIASQSGMLELYTYPWGFISSVSIIAMDFIQQVVNITFPEDNSVYQYSAANFQSLLPAAGKHHLTKISR